MSGSFHSAPCFQVRPCCSTGQDSVPSSGRVVLCCMDRARSVPPVLIRGWTSGLPPLDNSERCCRERGRPWIRVPIFSSLRCIPKSGNAGSCRNSVFDFWRNRRAVSHAAVLFYVPASKGGSWFRPTLTDTCYFPLVRGEPSEAACRGALVWFFCTLPR